MHVISKESTRPLIPLRDLVECRDLFFLLVAKEIKVRYKELWVGLLFALLQPALTTLLFLFFLQRSGEAPLLFTIGGVIPWIYISNQIVLTSSCFTVDSDLMKRLFFPRLLLPLAKLAAGLFDLAIQLIFFAFLALYFQELSPYFLLAPLWILYLFLLMVGPAALVAALGGLFRDIRYLISFTIQLGIFLLPILYPLESIDPFFLPLYSLNPFVAPIELLRLIVTGKEVSFLSIAISTFSGVLLSLISLKLFHSAEKEIADLL